jgi:hypothetical protein
MGWPHDQRDLMIALGRVERNTGQYGEWLPDVVTPWGETPARPSLADGPLVNWQQKAIEDAREAHRKAAGPDANLNGLFWVARPD